MSKNELSLISAPSLPIETKLTKSEVIDLIIDSMTTELKQKQHVLEQELQAVSNFSVEEITDLLVTQGAKASIRESWNNKTLVTVNVQALEVKPTGALKDRLTKIHAINAELTRLRQVQNELEGNKARAKNEILKRFLEQTEEGRTVLEQINGFKLKLQTKMLAAAK